MPTKTLSQEVAATPLFHGMSEAERLELVGLLEVGSHKAGEIILHEGPSKTSMWIVLEGRCEIFKATRTGKERVLAAIEPLGVFGEMSFFHEAPHSASVRAITDVRTARLPHERYDMLHRVGSIAAYKLALNTVKVLADRLRKMDEWACDFVERMVPEPEHHEEWHEFQSKLYTGWKF